MSAGKKTRITAVLRELFGSGVEKVKVVQKEFKVLILPLC
jgi:replication factor C subunit 3/5